jgi:NADPH2:quinone reductase
VSEVGYLASAAGFNVGDRVIAVCRGGTYASELQTDRRHCLKLPAAAANADLTEAAALLISYGTAHLALQRARLAEGETVLVTAAAGSVGLAAVELAKAMGAGRVMAACGSDAKLAVAQERGAQPPGVNYAGLGAKEFRSKVRAVAGEQGVDVMVDMVGGELLEAGVRSLNWNGRAVVIGFASGEARHPWHSRARAP